MQFKVLKGSIRRGEFISFKFTKKFIKYIRLSLGFSTSDMARHLELSPQEYELFENEPLGFGSELINKYLKLLDSLPEIPNLGDLFIEFARFDLLDGSRLQMKENGSGYSDCKTPLRLVK